MRQVDRGPRLDLRRCGRARQRTRLAQVRDAGRAFAERVERRAQHVQRLGLIGAGADRLCHRDRLLAERSCVVRAGRQQQHQRPAGEHAGARRRRRQVGDQPSGALVRRVGLRAATAVPEMPAAALVQQAGPDRLGRRVDQRDRLVDQLQRERVAAAPARRRRRALQQRGAVDAGQLARVGHSRPERQGAREVVGGLGVRAQSLSFRARAHRRL